MSRTIGVVRRRGGRLAPAAERFLRDAPWHVEGGDLEQGTNLMALSAHCSQMVCEDRVPAKQNIPTGLAILIRHVSA